MCGIENKPAAMLVGALLVVLVSCAQRSVKAAAPVTPAAPKPVAAAPPPPPPPLSSPQTRVELPTPQPIDAAALETASAPVEAPAVTRTPPARRTQGGTPTPAAPAAPAAQPPEPARVEIQEVISPVELRRLLDQAQARRKEANQILEQLKKRRLARGQQNVVTSIRSFLTLSEEAEKRNDMRQADALAERAQLLARDLLNGK
jgi:hypothetical protein